MCVCVCERERERERERDGGERERHREREIERDTETGGLYEITRALREFIYTFEKGDPPTPPLLSHT